MKKLIRNYILKPLAIIIVKWLQKKYRKLSYKHENCMQTQAINNLILIQSILYWFKKAFSAWGYFHPSMVWTANDEYKFRELFPEKDFREIPVVIEHNPEAILYYQNRIFELSRGRGKSSSDSYYIKQCLKAAKKWN